MTAQAVIYTDGACIGSGGNCPGGYAAVILIGDEERLVTGRSASTTNTAMELMGAIAALEALPPGLSASIHTDSHYVVSGATERLPWWRSRGWRIVKGGKLANRDLWQRLAALIQERPVSWVWLKGHAGDRRNEQAHTLAYAQAQQANEHSKLGKR
ncbi:ribonuclease H family protein [Microvirga terricola]|uniref:ribonuclease H n=1 Tax=Microvirga terricola TaxID=2719797 RepID=A0ABX0VCG1_9HYPH|nr:ribonuclease H [Microvirga terricola]NIX76380.1 ribonuclease HI [Microvirga terricola]